MTAAAAAALTNTTNTITQNCVVNEYFRSIQWIYKIHSRIKSFSFSNNKKQKEVNIFRASHYNNSFTTTETTTKLTAKVVDISSVAKCGNLLLPTLDRGEVKEENILKSGLRGKPKSVTVALSIV